MARMDHLHIRTYVFPTFEGAIVVGAGLCKTLEQNVDYDFQINHQKGNVRAAD